MNDQKDRRLRILLAILFFPIGLILALAGVRTRIIAWSFAGFYLWLLTVIVILGVIGDSGESIPGDPVQAGMINEPDPTMLPTSTPIPTSITEGCPTSEERAYFAALGVEVEAMGEHFQELAILNQQMAVDPALVVSDAWKGEVVYYLSLLNARFDIIGALDSPKSLQSVRGDIDQAIQAYRQFVALFSQGVALTDGDLLVEASEFLELGDGWLESAGQRAETYCR